MTFSFWFMMFYIRIEWRKKKGLWNLCDQKQRHDIWFGYHRVYIRKYQEYNHNIIIGKLLIMWTKDE